MRASRATFAMTDAAAALAQSRSALITGRTVSPVRAGGSDVVVVAVEDDDRRLGHDAVRAEVGECPDRREPERAHDADLVDLDGAGPADCAGGHPRRRTRGDLRAVGARARAWSRADPAGPACAIAARRSRRHPPRPGRRARRGRLRRTRSRSRALAAGAVRGSDGARSRSCRSGHSVSDASGSGTPANTSWWKSSIPNRSNGQVIRKARPTTFSIGHEALAGLVLVVARVLG